MIQFIDSHVHLDHVYASHPDRISWMQKNRCVPVSWSFCNKTMNFSDIENCLKHHCKVVHQLFENGFRCYYLAGVHPRNITPDLKPEQVRELLYPYLDDPLCLGIGEIGLETGSMQEKDVLNAHLELADELARRKKVFGIHTPRNNKDAVTRMVLDILEPYAAFKEYVVIDHCTPPTAGKVLDAGYWAGITLSPVKASGEDVIDIIQHNQIFLSRIMLNTDSGNQFYEDLYFFINQAELAPETLKAISRNNAARFMGIDFEAVISQTLS